MRSRFESENMGSPVISSMKKCARGAIICFVILGYAAAYTNAFSSTQGVRSSADIAGPALPLSDTNISIRNYNEALRLYEGEQFEDALEAMRAAVRAQDFDDSYLGFVFSNLCLMYLRVEKFKNAQAACTKALDFLPGYIPATINLIRAKDRTSPE